ncbi:hypothetical protein Cantr_06826 [Candida viswanathii]|uniref:Uncharacterized protein n=1 Tax=Candida viswanathii TaxID=5486 RepID=A0A367XVT6_9ASCO|nr:hypothetical protein Cantr_06826 [Candida viswanathii]
MTVTLTSTKSIISPQPTKVIPTSTTTTTTTTTTAATPTTHCAYNITPTPTPRSTPFYLDQYGLEELDENESIISELSSSYQSQSILQDYHRHDFIFLGGITHPPTPSPPPQPPQPPQPRPKAILAPYIFCATNLLHISNHFINCEFDSFSNHVILNPTIPKTNHTDLIAQLLEMYTQAVLLKNAVLRFNAILDTLKTLQLMSVVAFKKNLDLVVDNELNIPVHTCTDQIIDGLYQYNLTVEDCLEDEKPEDVMDEDTCQTIRDFHFKIESLLYLNDPEFNVVHVEKFYNLLMTFCTD